VKRAYTRKRIAGFTLVELMIVVLVVSILVGVAVPTYQTQVRKSRRTDAKTALMDMAGREAKVMTLNNGYSATTSDLGYAGTFPQTIGSGYYQIHICMSTTTTAPATCTGSNAAATGLSYVATAIPIAGTSQIKDTSCQYFSISNTGVQFASDSAAGTGADTTSTCWQ